MTWASTTLLGALLLLFVHTSTEVTPSVSKTRTQTQSTSITHSTPTPTFPSTPSPSQPTSTHITASHSHSPSATPSPSSGPSLNEYVLNSTDPSDDNELRVCLRMISRMIVTFEYATKSDKWESFVVPVGKDATVNRSESSCKLTVCAEPSDALLVVEYQGLSLALKFDELVGNEHWSYNSTTINYTISDDLFPNIADSDLLGKSVTAVSKESLFDWTISYLMIQSSYLCVANTTVTHFHSAVVNDTAIRISVTFSDLQVQAFKFTKDVEFDENESCYADRKIVVPVAVAGALALLASSVLIVSLIRLCWNKYQERKPQNYQHLSANVDY